MEMATGVSQWESPVPSLQSGEGATDEGDRLVGVDAFRLDGRVALVTGAGSSTGIGRAIALTFGAAGAAVAAADLDEVGARATAEALTAAGARSVGLGADLTDPRRSDGQWRSPSETRGRPGSPGCAGRGDGAAVPARLRAGRRERGSVPGFGRGGVYFD